MQMNDMSQSIIQTLKVDYLKHLGERKARLEQLLLGCENNTLTYEDRLELRTQAHKLAGTGTTYGFPDISEFGRKLEDDLIDYPNESPIFFISRTQDLLKACTAALTQEPTPAVPVSDEVIEEAEVKQDLPLLLVVDDDDIIRNIMLELFKDDARIITGVNATEAMSLMQQHKPDLVLLDDMMPGGVSGLQFLEDRQSMPEIKNIPVIVVTGSDTPEEVMRGLLAGAADYITKPFKPEEVAAKVRGRLKRQHSAILIADDDEAVRELLEHKFHVAGCKVVCVPDGNRAWDMMLKRPFSLVILDRMMPGHDGITLLRMMQENPTLKNTPVVFLTARHYGSDVLEGLNTGAADYITKPFNPDEVVARCLKLLSDKRG
jgi:DNA-binding response OmpR family regulator/HPt (histidine-containing phosphotransfer) domain-containing protein